MSIKQANKPTRARARPVSFCEDFSVWGLGGEQQIY